MATTSRHDDRYEMWDAAYVLGSLSSNERREYETHLSDCPPCRMAVAELSGMPALLALLDATDVRALGEAPAEPPPLRPEVLDALLEKVGGGAAVRVGGRDGAPRRPPWPSRWCSRCAPGAVDPTMVPRTTMALP